MGMKKDVILAQRDESGNIEKISKILSNKNESGEKGGEEQEK
jgi:hypothetical protein